MIKRLTTHAAALLTSLALAGCATTSQPLSQADRAKHASVRISDTVTKPAEPYLLAPGGANIGLMFGALGGAAASGTIQDNQKLFARFLETNSISIEKIAREEIEAALRSSNKFQIAAGNDPAIPEIRISILQYGFSVPHLLSSEVVPTLLVQCEMKDSTGKLLWAGNDRILPSIASSIESTNWEEMQKNPQLAEKRLREGLRVVANTIMQEL